jgi:DNA-binding transcriptional ArsR family regulator
MSIDHVTGVAYACAIVEMKRARKLPELAAEGTCATVYVDLQRVKAARAKLPPSAEVERVADVFSVLSDPTRLRILIALGTGELCVCDLSKVIERSMAATSHQLQLLRRAGVVQYRMAGKLAYYSLGDTWTASVVEDVLRGRAGTESGG